MSCRRFDPRGRLRRHAQLVLVSAFTCGCVSDEQPQPPPPPVAAAPNTAPTITNAESPRPPAAVSGTAGQASAAPSPSPSPPAPSDDETFRELVAADWDLPAGTEKYVCARSTSKETLFMDRLRTVLPQGTHHVAVMASARPDQPDGVVDCNILSLGERLIAGGGPGSQDIVLPDGVAMRYDRGDQILMQLHLFNATDHALHGRASTLARTLDRAAVMFEAEQVPAQVITLNVPRGRSVTRGRCTFDHDQTIVSVTPHMHQTGKHAKATVHTAKGDVVVHDADYDFLEQRHYPFAPIQVTAGDYLDYACTFENDTDHSIGWGESTTDEMCLFGTMRFPRVDDAITCLW